MGAAVVSVVALIRSTPSQEVVEKLREAIEGVECGTLSAHRVIIAFQCRDPDGSYGFTVMTAGDFGTVADEIGLLETAKYTRLNHRLGGGP